MIYNIRRGRTLLAWYFKSSFLFYGAARALPLRQCVTRVRPRRGTTRRDHVPEVVTSRLCIKKDAGVILSVWVTDTAGPFGLLATDWVQEHPLLLPAEDFLEAGGVKMASNHASDVISNSLVHIAPVFKFVGAVGKRPYRASQQLLGVVNDKSTTGH